MLKVCLIVLSCYSNAYDSKKTLACAINASEIIGIERRNDRYAVWTTSSKFPIFNTIVESPSKVKELVDKCYKE